MNDCGCGCGCGADTRHCGHPAGSGSTPLNPPGLSTIAYRVGTHGSFLAAMKARLSGLRLDGTPALEKLTARTSDDPSIAVLDAWATVADVLTFYQERIANEGYLRTATERRSILELARLIGYRVRSGVAASTHLAYVLDVVPGKDTNAIIPRGSRAQSLPGPGELPQSFETAEDLNARSVWNVLLPRTTRPTALTKAVQALFVEGISNGVRPNDRLLLEIGGATPVVRLVDTVIPDVLANVTELVLQPRPQPAQPVPPAAGGLAGAGAAVLGIGSLLGPLNLPPAVAPAGRTALVRDPVALFAAGSDLGPQMLAATYPAAAANLYRAWAGASLAGQPPADRLQVERLRAVPYGATASLKPVLNESGAAIGTEEWPLESAATIRARVSYRENVASRVVVEVTDGTRTATAAIDLPVETTVTLPSLGTVEILQPSAGGVATDALTLKYDGPITRSVIIGTPPVVINLAPPTVGMGNGPEPVVFDDEPVFAWRPGIGETLHRADPGRRVTVQFIQRPRTLVVSLEEPQAPINRRLLPLDTVYEQILPNTWIVLERPDVPPTVRWIEKVETVTRNSYNLPATITQLTLDGDWLVETDRLLSAVRQVSVYAQAQRLTLAPEPCTEDVSGDSIELDGLYDGLATGRLLAVSGERTDIPRTTGVKATEIVAIAGVLQTVDPARSGDTVHTTVRLARDLAYTYRRGTVKIRGNVVAASHGESCAEVLGSGNGFLAGQAFPLRRGPLTYVAADTAAGSRSTLEIWVGGVRWQEEEELELLGPNDHRYLVRTDDPDATTVVFGDGRHGARLPTGAENVTASYRIGIGRGANVGRGRITQLQTRPLGVNGVTNPVRASGGADGDTLAQARRNVPLSVLALDRLISVTDYADFARSRAGIGKASSQRIPDGSRTVVHLTVAGVDDAPLAETSALFQNLRRSLVRYGDPGQPTVTAVRELVLIVLESRILVAPEHRWDVVEPLVRAALLEKFGFDQRAFGQDVLRSEVVAAIQAVPGVSGAAVTALAVVPGDLEPDDFESLAAAVGGPVPELIRIEHARYDSEHRRILPAQLALLSSAVPDLLILRER